MKKLLTIAATGLVLSTSVFAGYNTVQNETEILSKGYTTQTQAYEAGFDIVDDLQSASNAQLKFQLPTTGDSSEKVAIQDVEVSIEEYSANRGEVQYRAIVDVEYTYTIHENSNS